MTVPLDELRTPEVIAWAEDRMVAGHHFHCALNTGGECDCYLRRGSYQAAAWIVAAVNHLDALVACGEALRVAPCERELVGAPACGTDAEADGVLGICGRCAALAALSRGPSTKGARNGA